MAAHSYFLTNYAVKSDVRRSKGVPGALSYWTLCGICPQTLVTLMNVWLHRLVFVLVCLTVQHTAHAQMAVLIVIQRSNASELSACEQRLRSELSAEGYQPTTVQVTSDPNAAVLVETTKRLTQPRCNLDRDSRRDRVGLGLDGRS